MRGRRSPSLVVPGSRSDEPAGFLVPNARSQGQNLVLLGTYVGGDDVRVVKDHGRIDWTA